MEWGAMGVVVLAGYYTLRCSRRGCPLDPRPEQVFPLWSRMALAMDRSILLSLEFPYIPKEVSSFPFHRRGNWSSENDHGEEPRSADLSLCSLYVDPRYLLPRARAHTHTHTHTHSEAKGGEQTVREAKVLWTATGSYCFLFSHSSKVTPVAKGAPEGQTL